MIWVTCSHVAYELVGGGLITGSLLSYWLRMFHLASPLFWMLPSAELVNVSGGPRTNIITSATESVAVVTKIPWPYQHHWVVPECVWDGKERKDLDIVGEASDDQAI